MAESVVELNPNDRVYIERAKHPLYQRMLSVGQKDPENTPFLLLKDAFLWAVLLGYQAGERTPLSGSREGIFWYYHISREVDLPILKTVALAETSNLGVLQREDEIMNIAQEYANTGIHLLDDALFGDGGKPLWNLLRLARAE